VALTDEAIGKIKQMIISGRVGPGEKLPREADLAAELGLSRSSLREAVKALTLVNVLDVRQGDGTYTTSLAPSLLLEALSFIVDFHRDDSVLEFLEVRRIVEPAATALAAVRMSAQDKAGLGETLAAATVDSPVDDFIAADLEFHRQIAVGSGNQALASLVESMSLPTARARMWRGMTEPGALERALAEHRAIYRAIDAADADLARSWATVHIASIESWLHQTLGDRPTAGLDHPGSDLLCGPLQDRPELTDKFAHRHGGPRDRDVDGRDNLAVSGADGHGDGTKAVIEFLVVDGDAGAADLAEFCQQGVPARYGP